MMHSTVMIIFVSLQLREKEEQSFRFLILLSWISMNIDVRIPCSNREKLPKVCWKAADVRKLFDKVDFTFLLTIYR